MHAVYHGGVRAGKRFSMCWVGWVLLLSALLVALVRSERPGAHKPAAISASATFKQIMGPSIVTNLHPAPQLVQLPLPSRSPARELQQGKQQGFCSLNIQGHGSGKVGIARASLSCQGYSELIPICVNMTHLGKFVTGFKGVKLLNKLPCHQDDLGLDSARRHGLLYFSDFDPGVVRLVDPVVRDIWLTPTIPAEGHAILPEFLNVISIADSARVEIERGTFEKNFGGSVIRVTDNATVVLNDTSCSQNRAYVSPCLHLTRTASVSITGQSNFSKNSAVWMGGSILAAGKANLLVKDRSVLTENRAGGFGGALACLEAARCTFAGANSVVNNSAVWQTVPVASSGPTSIGGTTDDKAPEEAESRGGGIHAEDLAVVELSEGAAVLGNVASSYGGGIALMELAVLVVDGAFIAGNEAAKSGGGVHASGQTRIMLANSSRVEGNSAQLYGGGFLIVEQANFTCQSGSVILDNAAVESGGGGVAAVGIMGGGTSAGSVALLDGCVLMENTCQTSGCYGGGVLIVGGTSLVLGGVPATASAGRGGTGVVSVKGNRGSGGAGILVSGEMRQALVTFGGSVIIADNQGEQGGGMVVLGNVSLTVPASGVNIVNNSAAESGGGLWLAEFTGSINSLPNLVGSIHDNKAGSGYDIYADPTSFELLSPPVVESVSRVRNDEGGVVVFAKLTGFGGLPSANCTVNAVLQQEGGKNWDGLGAFLSNETGVVALNLKLKRPPGMYAVSFTVMENISLQANITLQIRGCKDGEVGNIAGDVCEVCPVGSYSLDPRNVTCDPCPPGAYCPGGALVLPTPGFWHSAGTSTQFHR